MKRELVISSDDLGMTLSINRGIEIAYRHRALTSANFMVPCPWFEHAAKEFRHSQIDLGVHLTLTCEWDHCKWRPLSHGRSLLDTSGYLYSSIQGLMENATVEDIRAECRLQIATALSRGLPIVYADLHMCIPTIGKDPISGAMRVLNPDHELALMRLVEGIAQEFGLAYPYALDEERLRHFKSALSISGKSRSAVQSYLTSLEAGVHHLSCHCSTATEEQENLTASSSDKHPWAAAYRIADLECITAAWFKDLLQACQIELVRMPFSKFTSTSRA
jgi:chitin disaccharide deacetylase